MRPKEEIEDMVLTLFIEFKELKIAKESEIYKPETDIVKISVAKLLLIEKINTLEWVLNQT
jgi:hypothetical protein